MKTTDVTKQVGFGNPDDELLPVEHCVCGVKFAYWREVLHEGPEDLWECPSCHRRLYFTNQITIYEVKEGS